MPDDKKRTFESITLGLPPLKMVLVNARNQAEDKQRGTPSPVKSETTTPADHEKAIRKLIELREDSE